jgi:hypothetical protein
MKTRGTLLALCALSLMFTREVRSQGALTPPGPPEPTMRTLDQIEPRTPISSLPFAITQPGSYVVVRNLSGAAGGITVAASNVTIDLNGFTLTGDRLVLGHGIIVVPSDNVSVQNGVLEQWGGDGVHAEGVTDLHLQDVRVVRCVGDGVEAGSASGRAVTVADNDGAGLKLGSGLSAGKVSFQDFHFVRAYGNGSGGISYVGPCDASLSDSRVVDNTGHGVSWASSAATDRASLRLERCEVSGNTGSGLHVEESSPVSVACSTRASSFENNGGDGIALLLSSVDSRLALDLREGAASGNGGNGMNIKESGCRENANTLIDFKLEFNALAGSAKLDCDDSPSLFSGVVARGNGGRGLDHQGGAWTFEDCTVVENGAEGLRAVMKTGHVTLIKFADCDFARNVGAGAAIVPEAPGGSYKVSMQDMHFRQNGGGGLSLVGSCDVSLDGASVLANTGHGVSWASAAGGGGTPAAASFVRLGLRRLVCDDNTASGLYISEGGDVDVDCDFAACAFDRNGADGVTLLLTDIASRLDIVHRGGGACDNGGQGLNLAAGRGANQGFFDIALSRNASSGMNKIDAGASPGTMENVVAQDNGSHGLDLTGGTWSIGRCVVSDNTGGGVVYASKHVKTGHVSLLKVYDCDMERNGGDGLSVRTIEDDASYKVSMQDMHFRSNTGNGVHLSCDNALASVELDWLDCSSGGNAGSGVFLHAPVVMDKGLRFRLKGGDCDDNVNDGVLVDSSVDVRTGELSGLALRNNGGAGFAAPGGALRLRGCVASGNGGDGFLITRPPAVGQLYQCSLASDGCDAVRNGGSGLVVADFDASSRASLSVTGGQVCDNALSGIDLSTSPGARGRVHAIHSGSNLVYGMVSASSSLSVTENQFTGNGSSGLHVLEGAHHVARNVCTDNAVGVYLATTGSTVLQNTFGGGAGGVPQVPIEDVTGASDIAPPQNAATGTNPLGNQVF